jgi:hypothetical protein
MGLKEIPGARKRRLLEKRWPRELLYNIPPIIAAGIAAIKLLQETKPDYFLFGCAAIACIWLVVALIVRVKVARGEDTKDSPDAVHEGLYAAVSAVHHMLSKYCATRECGADLRATFHRVVPPVKDPMEIEQIINYVGGSGEGAGRTFPVNAGITGRAIRNRTPFDMSSETGTDEQLRDELVNAWGYTAAQARRLTPGRYSALAIPVLDASRQHAVGVIYLDSSDRALFARNDVMEIVGAGCEAISDFVTKRY